MTNFAILSLFLLIAPLLANFHGSETQVLNQPVSINERIGFDQKMGETIPTSLPFRDENEKLFFLKDYVEKGPVVLALVYYGCPNLCTLSLNGLFKSLGQVRARLGKDYSVVVVSIDPNEKPELARKKKINLLKAYGHSDDVAAIHFLTGTESSIQKLTASVGFRYVYDAQHKQFAHPAGIVVLTQKGKISRYLFGVEYASQDLRLAITEASHSILSSPVESFLLYCYHYDPVLGSYTFAIQRLLSISAILMIAGLFSFIWFMIRAERKRLVKVRNA